MNVLDLIHWRLSLQILVRGGKVIVLAALLLGIVPKGQTQTAQTPPMGWNDYNHYNMDISADKIKQAADAIVASGMRDAGYVYVNIDDGWEGERDSSGKLHPNSRFPDIKVLRITFMQED